MKNLSRLLLKAETLFGLGVLAGLVFLAGVFLILPKGGESPVRLPKNDLEFRENAEKRQEWFMFERTFPSGEFPENARRKAWDERPEDARFAGDLAVPTWESVGPRSTLSDIPNWGLTSGRINAIAVSPVSPNVILLGASTGGIWRSIDGGTNFTPVTDNQVDLAVGSISFAPTDVSIVYAGMGDKASGYYGSGVLKSTDGGQTWTRVSNSTLPSPGRVSQILVDQNDPNRVYVAQYASRSGNSAFASGFYVSTDGGVNWTRTLAGLPRDLVRQPGSNNIYYLAMARVDGQTPNTGGVFRSTDAGQTWTRVYTSPFATTSNMKLGVTPINSQVVYVLSGATGPNTARLEFSSDGGSNWVNRGSNFDVGQLSYNFYLFVKPDDANVVYVGTRDMWRSTDSGVNFTNITNNFSITGSYNPFNSKAHPDQHHFYQSPTNPNLIYLANDGGFYRSTDGAATFQSLNASLNLTQFVSLDLHPTDSTKSYGGTQDNGNQLRRGTQQWTEFISGDGGQINIDPVDPSIVYSTYVTHTIDRWNNNTDTYGGEIGNSTVFNADRVAFYPPFVVNGIDSTLYFGTFRLYTSTNRGVNWTAPGGATDLTLGGGDVLSAIGVGKSNTSIIYTGSAQGRVMVSTNSGANWTQITTGLPARFIKSIVVNPTNSNVAYLTVSGFDSGHVFKTTNAGTSWTDISGNLPNIPVNTIQIDVNNPNTLYIGTDVGVFRSTTDGTTWETFNNGMPPVIVTELDMNASGILQASTYGRGAYQINTLAVSRKPLADFDGDGKTDLSIFRPSSGQWWLNRSTAGLIVHTFGNSSDKLTPGDFTGDGSADVAIWRPSLGEWFVLRSENSTFYSFPFGANGDTPVQGDYDGDGKTDAAVFRPSNSTWYIQRSSGGTTIQTFGATGDKPVVADYDGDGKDDIAIFRAALGQWWLNRSTAGVVAVTFGSSTDKTVQGDYTGDGKADIAIWRPSLGEWFILRSEDFSFYSFPFGANGDTPAPGDYDGDGRMDASVFRNSNATWYLNRSTAGLLIQGFGASTDVPVPNVYFP